MRTVEPLRFHGNEVCSFTCSIPRKSGRKSASLRCWSIWKRRIASRSRRNMCATNTARSLTRTLKPARQHARRGDGLSPAGHRPAAGRRPARISFHPAGEELVGLLAPWFLAGIAALGMPFYVHLLRRHTTIPRPFSSLMFFERRTQSSIKHRRLRYLLLAVPARVAFRAAGAGLRKSVHQSHGREYEQRETRAAGAR